MAFSLASRPFEEALPAAALGYYGTASVTTVGLDPYDLWAYF